MEEFNVFFKNLMNEFRIENKLNEIRSPTGKIEWGPGFGVYTVFKQTIDYSNLLYVGLTGKYKRTEDGLLRPVGGSFNKRNYRWTPYRFSESSKDTEDYRFSFRFGPKANKTSDQAKIKYQPDAYKDSVPYQELIICSFDLSNSQIYSPSFLEALILNKYWTVDGRLPQANNQI